MKQTLRIGTADGGNTDMKQLASDLKQTLRIGSSDAEDQLKAMLGVEGPSTSSNSMQIDSVHSATPLVSNTTKASTVSDELKAILGVASVPLTAIPIQQMKKKSTTAVSPSDPASAPTAAEKLLQILSSKQQQQIGNNSSNYHHGPPAATSPFNFAYFEEGKEPPPVPANIGVGVPQYPIMHHQHVAYHPNYAIPGVMLPMQQPMTYPTPAFGNPQPMAPVPVVVPKFTPPMDEFPPLSLNPQQQSARAINVPSTTPVVVPMADIPATNGTYLKPASVLVPSAVKIRK